jgi:hypothetical protein
MLQQRCPCYSRGQRGGGAALIDWGGKARRGSHGYVTEAQRSRRPIFIANLRAARLLAGPAAAWQPPDRSVTDLVHQAGGRNCILSRHIFVPKSGAAWRR